MPCISFNLNEFSAVVCVAEFTQYRFTPNGIQGGIKTLMVLPGVELVEGFLSSCVQPAIFLFLLLRALWIREGKKKREWNRTWNCRTQGANVSAKKFLFFLDADDFFWFSFFECVYGGSWCKRGDDLLFGTSNILLFVIFGFFFIGVVGK